MSNGLVKLFAAAAFAGGALIATAPAWAGEACAGKAGHAVSAASTVGAPAKPSTAAITTAPATSQGGG